MKFILRRPFSIQVDATRVKTYVAGEYTVPSEFPREYAEKAKKQHLGFFVVEKKAPENKVVTAPETKKSDSRSTGSKPSKRSRLRKQN